MRNARRRAAVGVDVALAGATTRATTRATKWSLLTFVVAAVTGSILAVAPLRNTTCTATDVGPPFCQRDDRSLLESEGAGVLFVIAFPAALALVPIVSRSRRTARRVATIETLTVVIALTSIGLFFIPTVVLSWLAVRSHPPQPSAEPAPA